MNGEEGFTGFQCPSCNTEIEGTAAYRLPEYCPACGAKLTVPDNQQDDIVRHSAGDDSKARTQALKSRTIRIELDDL